MAAERIRASAWGLVVTALLAALIIVGSRNLKHFDAALVGYTFATLFAAFAIAYRYAMWLQRPPTYVYWRRGWRVFFSRRFLSRRVPAWFQRTISAFVLNAFIWRRSRTRWLAHWLIMWGCILAALITFPLVFGWIHFESPPDNVTHYRVFVFGFPTIMFAIDGWSGLLIFHGLVWSAFLVIPGVMIAMYRRMHDHGAEALQEFGEDFLPLILLFAISITGLMLTASYTWMKGYGYDFLAILHAVTVIFALLWLPFGKFFHIFQRPAQLGVAFYRDAGAIGEQARCLRCGDEYASQMHVDDLIEVERALGYRYDMRDSRVGHYQRICPRCRRSTLAIAQGKLWESARRTAAGADSAAVDIADLTAN